MCIPAQIPTMGCYNSFIACGPGVIITDSAAVHISGPQCMYPIRALQHNIVGYSSLYKRCKNQRKCLEPGYKCYICCCCIAYGNIVVAALFHTCFLSSMY